MKDQEISTDKWFDASHEAYSEDSAVDGVRDAASKTQGGNGRGSSTLEFGGDKVEPRNAINRRRSDVSAL